MGYKVLVTGSRTWKDRRGIASALKAVQRGVDEDEMLLIHGGAAGADMIADAVARELGWNVEVCPANWKGLGKSAGMIRNQAMVDMKPDLVLGFQVGESKGTADCLKRAYAAAIPIRLVKVEP